MINRGRYNNLHLYEVTEQDLLIPTETAAHYKAGNVLVFADKKSVDLGQEIAKADDIAAAWEYLENGEALLYERVKLLESQNQDLSTRIEQRDELLRDMSDDLRYERDMSILLNKQLDEVRYQLEIEALSRDELVGDLQQVSADTHTVEAILERTLTEKAKLEQELAARIADLVDLNFQNDDLRLQLGHSFPEAIHEKELEVPSTQEPQQQISPSSSPQDSHTPHYEQTEAPPDAQKTLPDSGQILTVSSGKQVHVYHEFPPPPKRTARTTTSLVSRTILRIVIILLIVVLLFLGLSVVATAVSNDVSMGEALDLLLNMVKR